MVVFKVVAVARARVREASGAAVLVADGILVDRGVGLGCAVVGRRDAITGFTAIVAVPVVHSTVLVLICTEAHGKKKKLISLFGSVLVECNNRRKEKVLDFYRIKARGREKNIMKVMIPIVMWHRDKRL